MSKKSFTRISWIIVFLFLAVLVIPQNALAEDEATARERRLRLSFHVGATYPLNIGSLTEEFSHLEEWQNLNDLADSNVHFRFNLDYAAGNNFDLVLFAGFSQFTDDYIVDVHYYTFNVSANIKWFFPMSGCYRWYIQGGPGWYIPKPSPPLIPPYPTAATIGANIGIGTQIPLSGSCKLEWGVDIHSINFFSSEQPKFWFLTLQLGVLF